MLLKTIDRIEHPYTNTLFYTIFGILLLTFCAYLFFRVQLIGLYRLDLGGLENNVIYGIQKILAGFPLYTNPEAAPFDLIQKSPAYYYLTVGLCHLFDVSTEQPIEIFKLSRVLSLLLNLASIGIYGLLAYQCFQIKRSAAVLISVAVMMTYTQHYYSRLDALYGFFFVLSLFFFFKYWQHFQKKYLITTALCCVLLVFSKQTGAVLVMAMGLSLFWTKNSWKKLAIFGSTGIIATIVLLFCWDVQPYFYYQNAVLGVKNGWNFEFIKGVLSSQYQLALIIACLLGMYFFCKTKAADSRSNLLLGLTLFYLIFGLLSCLKIAAGLNYLIEYKILLLLILGILAFPRSSSTRHTSTARFLLYAVVLTIMISKAQHIYGQYRLGAYQTNFKQYEKAQVLAKYFKEELKVKKDDYIYYEKNGFITHFLPTNMILPVKSTTSEIYTNHAETLNYAALLESMDNGTIKYVLVEKGETLADVRCLGQAFEVGQFRFIHDLANYSIYQLSATK